MESTFSLSTRKFAHWTPVKMHSICVMLLKGIDYKCGIKIWSPFKHYSSLIIRYFKVVILLLYDAHQFRLHANECIEIIDLRNKRSIIHGLR